MPLPSFLDTGGIGSRITGGGNCRFLVLGDSTGGFVSYGRVFSLFRVPKIVAAYGDRGGAIGGNGGVGSFNTFDRGAAGGRFGPGTVNYSPDKGCAEMTFNGAASDEQHNAVWNRLTSFNWSHAPTFANGPWDMQGEVFWAMASGGRWLFNDAVTRGQQLTASLIHMVGPDGLANNDLKFGVRATSDVNNTLAESAYFNAYAPAIGWRKVSTPAWNHALNTPLAVESRTRPQTIMTNGKTFGVASVRVETGEDGFGFNAISFGGDKLYDYTDTRIISTAALREAGNPATFGFTDLLIYCAIKRSGTPIQDSTAQLERPGHPTPAQTFMEAIDYLASNFRFHRAENAIHLVMPHEVNATPNPTQPGYRDAMHDWVEADENAFFHNIFDQFGANAFNYAGYNSTWVGDRRYFPGDLVLHGGTWYTARDGFSSPKNPAQSIIDGENRWQNANLVSSFMTNEAAHYRNPGMSDVIHLNRQGLLRKGEIMWANYESAATNAPRTVVFEEKTIIISP